VLARGLPSSAAGSPQGDDTNDEQDVASIAIEREALVRTRAWVCSLPQIIPSGMPQVT
jgi:hypothetical protein